MKIKGSFALYYIHIYTQLLPESFFNAVAWSTCSKLFWLVCHVKMVCHKSWCVGNTFIWIPRGFKTPNPLKTESKAILPQVALCITWNNFLDSLNRVTWVLCIGFLRHLLVFLLLCIIFCYFMHLVICGLFSCSALCSIRSIYRALKGCHITNL